MSRDADLAGRRVVVTGAAGGIGRAVAAELAARDAQLTLVGRRLEPLTELAASLPGRSHRSLALDVTDEAGWEAAAPELGGAGEVSGLVNAAGVLGPVGPLGSWTVEEFRRTVDANLAGTLIPILALLDQLASSGGSIVTFSGGGATGPFPRYDAYASSKAAVVRLTENLAGELAGRGVRINAVAPGFIASGMHQGTIEAGPETAGAAYFERTRQALAGSGGDDPRDAAELTAFLLSPQSDGITGRLISARWDPWRDSRFRDRLRREPDLATLRRIDDQFFGTREK